MATSAEHLSFWAMRLLLLLREMATRKTNAALNVLAGVDRIRQQCRYPPSGLLFADNHWRAYYHCHAVSPEQEKEHGHFHIFTDIGDDQWAHVAGLSVDTDGQPLQWFAVNRWVTDGPWLETGELVRQLQYISAEHEERDLSANWLVIMLQLYRDELLAMLEDREEKIGRHLAERDRESVLAERELYTLATRPIDIPRMLESHLLYNRNENIESVSDGKDTGGEQNT